MLSLAALAVLSPDERGFVEDIYLKYEKKLYAEALGITGNRHDAEDAVENAVLGVILLRMIHGYTSDEVVKILRVIRANGAGRHGARKRDYPREHMEHGRLMVFRPYPDRLRRFR